MLYHRPQKPALLGGGHDGVPLGCKTGVPVVVLQLQHRVSRYGGDIQVIDQGASVGASVVSPGHLQGLLLALGGVGAARAAQVGVETRGVRPAHEVHQHAGPRLAVVRGGAAGAGVGRVPVGGIFAAGGVVVWLRHGEVAAGHVRGVRQGPPLHAVFERVAGGSLRRSPARRSSLKASVGEQLGEKAFCSPASKTVCWPGAASW